MEPSVLADTLNSTLTFQDEMTSVDTAAVVRLYGIDEADMTAYKVYTSTGATAEEIAVFKAKMRRRPTVSIRRCRHGWKTRKPPMRAIIPTK